MGDHLGNLVFVVVALLAWIIKAAVERKEAQGGARGRARPSATVRADAGTGEVDVVYGRRRIPEALTAPRPRGAGAPAPVLAEAAMVPRTEGAPDLGALPARDLGTHIAVSTAKAAQARGSRRTPAQAWARLGVAGTTPGRDRLRIGVLWNEVLGLPRAVRGPHRSPPAERLRSRRA